MRAWSRRSATLLSVLVLCASSPLPALGSDEPTDIAALEDYTSSRPRHISEWGTIAGQVARLGEEPAEQAVIWNRDHHGAFQIEVLPPLPGLLRGDARGFARFSIPIGFSYLQEQSTSLFRAVAWPRDPQTGERVPLDLEPPPGFTDAQAFAGNARGLIVGEAQNPRESVNGLPLRHAVIWKLHANASAEVCDLGVPDGFDISAASDLNEFGLVVGTARRLEPDGDGGLRARAVVVVWWPAHFPDLCPYQALVLPAREDLPLSQSPTINQWGQVVARADRITAGQPTVSRPLVWQWSHSGFGDPIELPVPEGFTDAFARDVNSSGQVLGSAQVRSQAGSAASVSQAVVWRRRHGVWQAELLTSPADTPLVTGERINESGDVIGASPAPAPGSPGGLLWRHDGCSGHHH